MQIIYDLYKDYGYAITERSNPGPDGLFPVERRILMGTYLIAKDKFVKCAKIVGEVFGRFHPHSPESIYGTLAKLVRRGLLKGQGNFGKIALQDAPPAAMRYTEAMLEPKIRRIVFELIDFVPFKEIEGTEPEPTYLPSPVPLLVGEGLAEGISYWRFVSFLFPLEELFKALEGILDGKEYIPKPAFKGCTITSGDLKEFWTKGQGSYIIEPMVNETSKYIDVLGKLQNINVGKFDKEGIEYSDLSSKGQFRLRIYKKRGKNISKFVPKWNVKTSLLMFYDGKVYIDIGLKDMMMQQYSLFMQAYRNKLEYDKAKLEDKIEDMRIIEQIQKLIRQGKTTENQILSSFKNPVERERCERVIKSYPIRTLLRIKTDVQELKSKLSDLNKKLKDFDKSCRDFAFSLLS